MTPVQESFMRLIVTLVVCVPPLAYLNYCDIKFQKSEAGKLALIVSGQEATIASYKENLTECLKDNKMATQDEFTGE